MLSGLNETPRSGRVHIGIFGRTNAGKSSIINLLCGSDISVISPMRGTTTDPVYKAMELLPIGPVVFIDTPGLDDESEIGERRIAKTLDIIKKTDLAILIVSSEVNSLSLENEYLKMFQKHKVPAVVVINTIDGKNIVKELESEIKVPFVYVNALEKEEKEKLKNFIIQNVPSEEEPGLTDGIVKDGDTVLLVMPQDIQAPKGRLILPQVQMIRDLLDNKCKVICVITTQLADILNELKSPPDLVITDSQVFQYVNDTLDPQIPLTSFSVLLSKNKGDIKSLTDGARQIANLKENDRILIMEACTHHALKGDIARQKLPKLLREFTGKALEFEVFSGTGFPDNVDKFKLIIHCGGCMINRKNMLSRMELAKENNVPMTNFGTAIAFINGMLDRIVY